MDSEAARFSRPSDPLATLGVVIVTYNPGPDLRATVAALAGEARVVVVDNHSAPGREVLGGLTGEHLERVDLNENFGIAAALNVGLLRLLAAGCEWAVTLDQDSRLDPSYLSLAAALVAEAGPDVSLLAPRIVEQDGDQVYQGCPQPGAGSCEVDFAITSGSVLRIRDALRVGGFDDALFIDYVDFDLCLRLRAAGRRIVLHERLLLSHKIGSPLRRRLLGREVVSLNHSPIRRYYKHRNLPQLLREHRNIPVRWAARKVWSHLIEPAKIVMVERQRTEKISALVLGALDGIRGKMDRYSLSSPHSPTDGLKVSVCLASYNGERYLAAQLGSILSQLGAQDELIIQDDGSSDGTEQMVAALRDDRVRFERNTRNLGVIPTFENALRRATGDIIFLSDQDDLWLPWKLTEMLGPFVRRPGTVLVVGDAVLVDADERLLHGSYFELLGSRPGLLKNIVKNTFVGCCLAFRRELLAVALPIPVEPRSHDGWLGIVGTCVGEVEFLKVPTIYYRRHGANVSQLRRSGPGDILYRRLFTLGHFVLRLPRLAAYRARSSRGR